MATWKTVKLKDPVTGDYLIPLGGTFQGGDADTLQGHAADYFATKEQYNQLFQSVSEGKASIADAITDKGGSASATDTFAQLAAAIAAFQLGINTDDANAAAAQILSGYTAYVKGRKISGSMINRGSPSQSLNAGGSYNLSSGYYSGGRITAKSLASQTNATASASDILNGETAWVNGSRISGTMTNNGAVNQTINPGTSYTIPAGYHNGSGKVTAGPSTGYKVYYSRTNVRYDRKYNSGDGDAAKYYTSYFPATGFTTVVGLMAGQDMFYWMGGVNGRITGSAYNNGDRDTGTGTGTLVDGYYEVTGPVNEILGSNFTNNTLTTDFWVIWGT